MRYPTLQRTAQHWSALRLILSAFAVLVLAVAALSQITFEPPTFVAGSPNGQNGWSKTGPYDHMIHTNVGAPVSFGLQSLRISNALTSGSFGDQTFSSSIANEAGETSAVNNGLSGGTRQNRFVAEWQFISADPTNFQSGLSVVASPDRGDGARMSWVQMTDTAGGIAVNFFDFQRGLGNTCGSGLNFVQTNVASGLDRTVVHSIRIEMDFVDGIANDVVRVYVDGVLSHTGTSWEDYFRDCEANPTRTVDSILFRTAGTAAPATLGKGFLIDGMAMSSVTPSITVSPASIPTASDNDYTRINNAVQAIAAGGTITLNGVFNWGEANALASWALGSDGATGGAFSNDDWSILAPLNLNGVTVTAASLGSATIQGPGDVPTANLEGVFQFYAGGTNQNWTISNLEILDFDNPIGFYFAGGPTSVYTGTQLLNNRLRTARDLNATVAPADVNQNIGIHFAFGTNQTISGNQIEMYGDGVSDTAMSLFSTEVGMQSNTSGGNAYDGLQITNNVLRVLNAQDNTNPQRIRGIWENGHAHSSNILVSGNQFLNLAGGNNPLVNRQEAFWVTSHSSPTTTVTYSNNYVAGARIGIKWLGAPEFAANFAGNQPVQLTSNTILNGETGVLVQSNGLANLRFNRIVGNSSAGLNNSAGTVTANDNWWGCNFGPGATGPGCAGTTNAVLGTVTAATWLTLTTSASPTLIVAGNNSMVSSALTINSASVDTSGSGTIRNGTPVSFAGSLGTVAPPSSTTTAGLAGTTFTGTTAGAGSAGTTVDGQTATAAITVLPTCAPISIAAAQTTLQGASLTIPITTGDLTTREVYSYDFTYTYNPSTLTYTGISTTGTLSSGFTMNVVASPGSIVVSGFGVSPLAGAGTLLNVNFTASGPIGSTSNLTLSPFVLNEGVPCSSVSNGNITIISGTIDGTVSYLNQDGQNPQPRVVPSVNLNALGSPNVSGSTNGSGIYSLSGFGNSGYTVTPSKTTEVFTNSNTGISANDAARIAQHVVGSPLLTSNQQLAADVSNNGTITSFDSSIIARWVVGIATPGVTGTWRFVPTSRTYTLAQIQAGATGQNYDAILMGDVTGNWNVVGPLWEGLTDYEREQSIEVRIPELSAQSGSEILVPILTGETTGKGIISYQTELRYDPEILATGKSPCESAETLSGTMAVTCNAETSGVVRIAVFGVNQMLGKGELLRVRFNVIGEADSFSTLELVGFKYNESFPFSRTENGRIVITAANAAASVSGRITKVDGSAVSRAQVTIRDSSGNARSVIANNLGRFRFADLTVGGTYTIEVSARELSFISRTIVVSADALELEIVAEP